MKHHYSGLISKDCEGGYIFSRKVNYVCRNCKCIKRLRGDSSVEIQYEILKMIRDGWDFKNAKISKHGYIYPVCPQCGKEI